jgi:hypothetical protein
MVKKQFAGNPNTCVAGPSGLDKIPGFQIYKIGIDLEGGVGHLVRQSGGVTIGPQVLHPVMNVVIFNDVLEVTVGFHFQDLLPGQQALQHHFVFPSGTFHVYVYRLEMLGNWEIEK